MAARIGLTGGIGSGKSTVAACFIALGARVIDADEISRRLTAPGTVQFEEIVASFGAAAVGAEGRLNRHWLARVVFQSARKRQLLEAILHPPIRQEMHARARRDAGRYCILDIPLLIESGQQREMNRVLVVDCARAARIDRLRRARGMRDEEIDRVMRSQARDEQRLLAADDVIDNNGAVEAIEPQVRRLHENYLTLLG